MDLKTYLATLPRGATAHLASVLGVNPVMVSQWSSGVKPVPLERCTAMEKATHGHVRRWDLRPDDWHRIWPELIGTNGAPDVPATEVANG